MANDALLKDAIEIAKKQVLEKLALEEPYLFGPDGIYHHMKQFKNGEVSFTLRIFEGFVTDLVYHQSKRLTFKKK